jgi:hypothetical protein
MWPIKYKWLSLMQKEDFKSFAGVFRLLQSKNHPENIKAAHFRTALKRDDNLLTYET